MFFGWLPRKRRHRKTHYPAQSAVRVNVNVNVNVLHHLVLVNFDRRQLLQPIAEQLAGIGNETPAVEIPKRIGVALAKGQYLGIYPAFGAAAGQPRFHLRLTLLWTPLNGEVRPRDVLPAFLDGNWPSARRASMTCHQTFQPRLTMAAEYNSPLPDTLRAGGMGHMIGAFAPDDIAA